MSYSIRDRRSSYGSGPTTESPRERYGVYEGDNPQSTGGSQSLLGLARDTFGGLSGGEQMVQPGGTMPGGGSGHSALNPPGGTLLNSSNTLMNKSGFGINSTTGAPSAPSAPSSPGAPATPTVAPAPNARTAPTASAAPNARAMPEATQSVASHLDGILASGSPLMTRAATQGTQFANQRGLLNSSMAAGAAQGAMIDRATPIAQQDAGHYQKMQHTGYQGDLDLQKMGYDQERQLQQMGYAGDLNLQQMGYGAQTDMQKLGYGAEVDMARDAFAADVAMRRDQYQADVMLNQMRQQAGIDMQRDEWATKLGTESKSYLMDIEAGYARMMNQDQHAADAYKTMMQSIAMVNTNPELSPEQQQKATQDITNMGQRHLDFLQGMYGGVSDIGGSYTAFPGAQGDGSIILDRPAQTPTQQTQPPPSQTAFHPREYMGS